MLAALHSYAGESMPVKFKKGDVPKMGSTVVRGEVEATVSATGAETFFGKTASLLNSEKGMGHLQKMLLGIVTGLTVYTLVLVVICFIYLMVKCALPSLSMNRVLFYRMVR
jgi:H+-transporting ATPase